MNDLKVTWLRSKEDKRNCFLEETIAGINFLKLAHPVFISDTFIYQRESSENVKLVYVKYYN